MEYLIDCNHPGVVFACASEKTAETFFEAMEEEGSAMHRISSDEVFPDWVVCNVSEDFNPDNFNPFYYWWYTV